MTTLAPPSMAGRPAIGDLVISWYDEEPVIYGGPDHDRPGMTSLAFTFSSGQAPTRKCDPGKVAPADTPIPQSDERATVTKHSRTAMPWEAPGPWKLTLPWDRQHSPLPPISWHRTRRDARATGMRHLAILDWHAAQRS